jgi:hypothetical protein
MNSLKWFGRLVLGALALFACYVTLEGTNFRPNAAPGAVLAGNAITWVFYLLLGAIAAFALARAQTAVQVWIWRAALLLILLIVSLAVVFRLAPAATGQVPVITTVLAYLLAGVVLFGLVCRGGSGKGRLTSRPQGPHKDLT